MAAILIDYENVNGTDALRGVNELTEQGVRNIVIVSRDKGSACHYRAMRGDWSYGYQ